MYVRIYINRGVTVGGQGLETTVRRGCGSSRSKTISFYNEWDGLNNAAYRVASLFGEYLFFTSSLSLFGESLFLGFTEVIVQIGCLMISVRGRDLGMS